MQEYPYPFIAELMPFFYVIVFILGACVGSFLNVVIYRIPAGISLIMPASHCPKCKHNIAWYQNIPLLSYLCLGGKCANCACKISIRYFLIELLTAILFLLVFAKVIFYHEPLEMLVVYFALTMLVVTTWFIDIEHQIIPDKTTYPTMILGLLAAAIFPIIWNSDSHWRALVGASLSLSISGGLLALFLFAGEKIFKRDALGWGDVKYIAAIGACLGLKAAYFTLLFAAISGSIYGVALIIKSKKKLKSSISFGPFLALATYLWIIFDKEIITFYQFIFTK